MRQGAGREKGTIVTYNVERMKKLRKQVEFEAKLDKHDQSVWGRFYGRINKLFDSGGQEFAAVTCPSAACAAGWTVINAKAAMLFNADELRRGDDAMATLCLTRGGQVRDIQSYAAELLGLLSEDKWLFKPGHSTEDVLRYLDELIVAGMHNRTWQEQRELMEVDA